MRKLANKDIIKDGHVVKTFFKKKIFAKTINDKSAKSNSNKVVLTEKKSVSNSPVEQLNGAHKSDSYADYSLTRIKNLTTDFGIKHHIGTNKDLIICGIDYNATSLVIMCEHYTLTREKTYLELIDVNLSQYCLQVITDYIFKYVNSENKITVNNNDFRLADNTSSLFWALGYLISKKKMLPEEIVINAEALFQEAMPGIKKIHSIPAISYIIKGLYYNSTQNETIEGVWMIKQSAKILVNQYKDVENNNWQWFQRTITIESSLISEALLCAWLATGEPVYRQISKTSFDFLLSKIFMNEDQGTFSEEKMFEGKNSTQINTLIFALNTFVRLKKSIYKIKK